MFYNFLEINFRDRKQFYLKSPIVVFNIIIDYNTQIYNNSTFFF